MTKPLTSAQAAQQSNRTNDGKYTTKSHSEADVSLGVEAPEPRFDSQGNDWGPAFAEYEVESVRQHEIMHVHYNDEFSEDFIAAELSGDWSEIDRVREQEAHWEWENDAYDQEAAYAVERLGLEPDEARNEELFDELRGAIADSPNTISPYKSVRDNTPSQLMRLEVFEGENLTDHNEEAYHDGDAQVEVLEAKFKELGLDSSTEINREAIEDLVNNGPEYWHEGVSLDVIWSGPYTDAVPGGDEKSLSFNDPNMVLIDSFNGSGWEAQTQGTIKRTIGARSEESDLPGDKRAYLDNLAGEYGWGDIAGPMQSAYETEVEVQEHQPETANA